VAVHWEVTDPESGIAKTNGCETMIFSADMSEVTITCTAVNGVGLSRELPVSVKIDQTPPKIGGMPSSCVLWPPNGRLVHVSTLVASDSGSGATALEVMGTSSQPLDHAEPDIVIVVTNTASKSVSLRARRLGNDPAGRVYTLTATALDVAGNQTAAKGICTVPHDQRR
jgi:hypothetical protein